MNYEKFIATNHKLKDREEKNNLSLSVRRFLDKTFSVWDIWDVLPGGWSHRYYNVIRPLFKPENERIRKAIPRNWCDISHLIEIVNFEFIKTFYEEEYINGNVDWEATPRHKEFADWLEAVYKYITIERPQLEKTMDAAYPPTRSFDEIFELMEETPEGKKRFKMKEHVNTYEELYGEVDRLEKLIDDKDTEVLTEFVKRRHFFWS